MKKAFGGALTGKTHRHGHRHSSSMSSTASFTDQDVAAVIATLDEKWNAQVARMQKYLFRNYCLSQGVPYEDDGAVEGGSRQTTASGDSSAQTLERVQLDRTPTMAIPSAFSYIDEKLGGQGKLMFQMPEN